jgi:Post-segregation antitoxin CcdA
MFHMRKATSLTLSEDLLAEIASTKQERSLSERVNELLRRALVLERTERLEREAAEFFASAKGGGDKDAPERRGYRKASRRVLARD